VTSLEKIELVRDELREDRARLRRASRRSRLSVTSFEKIEPKQQTIEAAVDRLLKERGL
jgi:hypothetical protein